MIAADTLHTVYLHGKLGKEYGKDPITIFGTSVKDVFQGLCSGLGDNFKETIKTGMWHITTGTRKSKGEKPSIQDNLLDEKEVDINLVENEIHVFPQVKGAGGALRIIIGVVLIIVAVVLTVVTWGAASPLIVGAITFLVGTGASLVIGGAMQLMTSAPKVGDYQAAEVTAQRPSFLFNGVVNTVEQGGPVPLVYGIHLTGSTVISAGMTVEQQ